MARINIAHGTVQPAGLGVNEPWMDDSTGIMYVGDRPVTGSNPNLLDNWNFRNPVNGRGQNSYTFTSGSAYSIDRWASFMLEGGSVTINLNASGLSIFSTNDSIRFRQRLENPARFSGETITLSVKFAAASGTANLNIIYNDVVVKTSPFQSLMAGQIVSITCTLPTYISGQLAVQIDASKTTSITLDRAKLELGPVSTLALDGPADYGTELAKCQRYYLNYGAQIYLPGMSNATGAFFCAIVDLPTMMRISPTVLAGNGIQLDIGGTRISTTIAYTGILAGSNRQLILKFTPTASIPANHAGVILVNSLALSAEL